MQLGRVVSTQLAPLRLESGIAKARYFLFIYKKSRFSAVRRVTEDTRSVLSRGLATCFKRYGYREARSRRFSRTSQLWD